ncbi:MAG TPA: S-layer homology domain-containing protein [Candidatus Acidoferrum sp.]|nr:S-layer homology domain-containing protein [Candidatus Acidoferrum sp.]
MRRKFKIFLILCLCFTLLTGLFLPSHAADFPDEAVMAAVAAHLCESIPAPGLGSVGGEWAVMGLARAGSAVPDGYYVRYYANLLSEVNARQGVLSDRKYTEYARVILALTALGADPADVAGYDLLTPLGDCEATIWQGLNGPVWALIALDSGGYDMPVNAGAKTQATRERYLEAILAAQNPDGGFSLAGGSVSDPDMTGMALQALARYMEREGVAAAVERALACLSERQRTDGCFETNGVPTLESTAQVVVALCELGVPLDDARFAKENGGLPDGLMRFYSGDGTFRHDLAGGGDDLMATEQGFYALVAAHRARQGRQSLYRMGDAPDLLGGAKGAGLPGRHPDVKPLSVIFSDVAFSDIGGLESGAAISGLAARGVLSGRGDGRYDPAGSMTRAEFCKAVVLTLGLTPAPDGRFSDVVPDGWYAGYVGAAAKYGIVNGVTDDTFAPARTITRQEAAAMLMRAAKLAGLDTALDGAAVTRQLAAFDDGRLVAPFAREALAFCYDKGIFDDGRMEIRPAVPVTRAEVALSLWNLLTAALLA